MKIRQLDESAVKAFCAVDLVASELLTEVQNFQLRTEGYGDGPMSMSLALQAVMRAVDRAKIKNTDQIEGLSHALSALITACWAPQHRPDVLQTIFDSVRENLEICK